ncbi:unnamed protein product [Dibothriocephalus latus]|uniref:Uncharacterized protein n=1 Tax=Dibothriocephalus latus TaxID=60516 RepID=A0A3P7P794_DIBLA|nr:unnamed protein product [Dibothriocephalus latus]
MGAAEHKRHVNFIMPKNPWDISFMGTLKTLSLIFGEQSSLFNTRFQCFQLCKRESDDIVTYAGIVNREYQLKCLIFISGLQSPKDAGIRERLLAHVHQSSSVTLQELAAESQTLINL